MQRVDPSTSTNGSGPDRRERTSAAAFGSDVIVELLRELEIPYVALNPGASYRGLHDSLVNFGAGGPEIILCTHEEIAVAIAHGYARATGRTMAAALHNVVGLQHATMAIFNAWCDRAPVLLLGGTGPMDATKRRPYIDWIHTALVQGNQVRDYVKWDDQPASVAALGESVLRGYRIAMTEPRGPVYLCFDVETQEERVTSPLPLPDVKRFAPSAPPAANPAALHEAARVLTRAERPLIVADTVGRNPSVLPALQELAEVLGAGVVDQGGYFNFPSNHPLDVSLAESEALDEADVLLALDVPALGGRSSGVKDRGVLSVDYGPHCAVIHITMSDYLQHSWASDFLKLPAVDLPIAADTQQAIPELLALCKRELAGNGANPRTAKWRDQLAEMRGRAIERLQAQAKQAWDLKPISAARLYGELWPLLRGTEWALLSASGRLPIRSVLEMTEPAHWQGGAKGGGLGYHVGGPIGAALAYKGTGRLPVAVIGDGEFLMTPSALWTASHYEIPLLMIIFNNHSYYNDEGHQEYLARERERPVENAWVGIHISEPITDFATLARSFSVTGYGPVEDPNALSGVLKEAIATVRAGKPALVDVRTQPR